MSAIAGMQSGTDSHTFIMRSEAVHIQILAFLQTGYFNHDPAAIDKPAEPGSQN